ncbi:hypothetical protein FB567DRAFT_595956 [Paraphoma chrysanthemicola]|uniref:SnoaL-like domain-containing protein n=1 Tax=Paraphoma chrysanthemicola TaxID=798071 RepID=A0A8K0VVE9_9PLEO|nr:hypothetical protein FB567DRAFT_595956 [Paraphoma chrysanthemicola]
MTSKSQAEHLTLVNLHSIFGNRDSAARLSTIQSTWVPSGDALFIEPNGVFKTHEGISDMAGQILASGGDGDKFWELGEIESLAHDDETDTWVTRLQWGVGASKDELKVRGWDVVTITGGKVKACYTFLDK